MSIFVGDGCIRVTLAAEWAKLNWFEVSIRPHLTADTCHSGYNKMCGFELQHASGKGLTWGLRDNEEFDVQVFNACMFFL